MSGALGDHSLSSAARVPATTLVCAGVHPPGASDGPAEKTAERFSPMRPMVCPIALSDGLFGETGRSAPSRVRPLPRVEIVDIKFDPEVVDLHEERVSVCSTCKAPVSFESWRRMTWSVTSGADRSPRHRSAPPNRLHQEPDALAVGSRCCRAWSSPAPQVCLASSEMSHFRACCAFGRYNLVPSS